MAEPNLTTSEIWLPIFGYENYYRVSNFGNVWSIRNSRHLKLMTTPKGYLRVCLCIRGDQKNHFVHRLVMRAFVGECPKNLTTNHKDGKKTNNYLSNLEYVTNRENHQHASKLNLKASGDRNGARLHPERMPRGDRHFTRTKPERIARGDRSGARTHPEKIVRGERSNLAKLKEFQVLEIKERLRCGESVKSIAALFNISRGTIHLINNGKIWKHLSADR